MAKHRPKIVELRQKVIFKGCYWCKCDYKDINYWWGEPTHVGPRGHWLCPRCRYWLDDDID